ncbi:MAG: Gfo/Idh/MocA family oxidoreductase [Planctomycetes bacterium]|nr:Gfo/Idh/MocA family oxidoreductase [Planctomycetota bacterium]
MSSAKNRRDFLKSTAAAGAVVSATGTNLFAAAGNETIKVGLIGCGGRGTGAVRNLLDAEAKINGVNPKVEIVAVADVFKSQADNAVKSFKDPKNKAFGKYAAQIKVTPETTFDGLDAYQKLLSAGVDLVILATPPGFRPVHLEAAVKAGKHIFCEKPVAVDAAGIRKCYEMVEESKKKNIAIVAGTQRRHQKGYIETIKKLQDGAIGDIVATRCAWNGNGIWFHGRAKDEADAHYQIRNWYHFLWMSGDHIVEQHVHNLDVINWIMNDHPIKAIGMGGRSAGNESRPAGDPNQVGNIWDHYAVEFEYKNGVKMYSYCRHIPGDNDVSEAVVGTKGKCRVSSYVINNEQVATDDIDAYVQEHIDLLNSIRASKPLNELKNVTDSTFTAILGRNASYACRTLKWDDVLKSNDDSMPKNLTLEASLKVNAAPTPGSWRLPPAVG